MTVAGHLRALKRAGTPGRAKGAAAYFKTYERLTFFGVASATVRRMAARIRREEGRLWTLAAGWVLREAGKVDMSRLDRFLVEHGSRLSRTTVSYAIERFPPTRRRQLLTATRARAGSAHGHAGSPLNSQR